MVKVEKAKGLLNPPGWLLLAAGVIAGLVNGLLFLPSSADTATAVGLAWFIGVSLGGWLGLATFRLLIAGFRLIYKNQSARVLTALSRLETRSVAFRSLLDKDSVATLSRNGHPHPSNANSPIFSKLLWPLWRFSWYFYPLGIIGTFAYGLVLILYYVGGMSISPRLIILAAGAAVTFPALLFAWLFPIILNWTILNGCRAALREIDYFERILFDASTGQPSISIPDLSAVEKAITTPPKRLSRLAA